MWYIHNGMLLSHKKNEILPFVITWMDLEGIMLSEVRQTEKDKYCIFSLIFRIKNQTKTTANKPIQIYRYREQRGMGWD